MLIKIAKNGIESEWFQLTKKRHRTLLLEKPDAVFVHIDSLYPKSPESGQIVELSFPCFNLLAYGPSNVLTDLQQRRLRLFLDGYTLTRIGEIEGISHTAVRKSVISAIEKIKKHFE